MSEYHNTKAEDRVPLGQKLAVGAGVPDSEWWIDCAVYGTTNLSDFSV